MLVRNKEINFFTAAQNYSLTQDTTIIQPIQNLNTEIRPASTLLNTSNDTTFNQISLSEIDSILKRGEEREQQFIFQRQQEARQIYRRNVDTTELLYKQFGIAGFPLHQNLETDPFSNNILYNFTCNKPIIKQSQSDVFIESDILNEGLEQTSISVKNDYQVKPLYIQGKLQFDWITILLIGTFFILGWVRFFNKKYLISLVKSVFSVQESNTLFRDKNTLMERASLIVNVLFVSNLSLFIVQLKHYFGLDIEGFSDYVLYILLACAIVVLYLFRALSSSFIAFVFLKQNVFSEYFHNVNVYTKNTGLILFPIVVILQFLSYEYIGFIILTGLILIGIMYLLLIIRAFQIIIRKNVSIFYMILYLCAFEFAPFLIVYKVLVSLD